MTVFALTVLGGWLFFRARTQTAGAFLHLALVGGGPQYQPSQGCQSAADLLVPFLAEWTEDPGTGCPDAGLASQDCILGFTFFGLFPLLQANLKSYT